jgi:hypothetical protein
MRKYNILSCYKSQYGYITVCFVSVLSSIEPIVGIICRSSGFLFRLVSSVYGFG